MVIYYNICSEIEQAKTKSRIYIECGVFPSIMRKTEKITKKYTVQKLNKTR